MTFRNELTDIATNELRAHGIKGHLRDTNGGHIEIAWQVVPEKEVRRVVVAKTPSDWRARMNTRGEIRRLLRADNVALKMTQTKPKKAAALKVERAMSLPQEILPIPDQVAALRSEVGDLTELVLRLTKIVTGVRDTIAAYVPAPAVVAPAPTSSRSIKLIEYLSHDRWVNVDTLPRDTGLKPEQIKLKLQYLKNHDEVEIFRGQVRLKQTTPKPKKMHWKTARKAAADAAKLATTKQPNKVNGLPRLRIAESN
ncbi:hypothetical protein ABID65_006724 [Bradyrhizobium sp. S3.9.2]|uniref:hypothetical protein n=1 Tax=Bradyrhizobium sp. S3.9.2 TaxID=3156432 RepID=UPI00339352F2